MQLVTLDIPGSPAPGVLLDDQVLDLRAAAQAVPAARCIPASVRGILEAGPTALDLVRRVRNEVGSQDALRQRLQDTRALAPRAEARLLAPVPDPRLVLSCGMNYRKHLEEMGGTVPAEPVAFAKNVHAVIGPDAAIVLPARWPDMVDWEIEFAAVIGRTCHDVPRERALDHVAGYTLINDVSARNWVGRFGAMQGMAAIEGWEHNLLGKHFPTFCPMGPTLVTQDELPDPADVQIQLSVNGVLMQSANTNDLVFDVATLIAYYSRFHTFQPGDVITTGSPAGVAFGRNPPAFLKHGDVVTLSAAGIGTMNNPVVGPR